MARIEDQRILIGCNNEENLQQTIVDAVYLALKLEKEICLFACYENKKDKNKLAHRLSLYAEVIKKDIPTLPVSTLILQGKLKNLMRELGEKYNAILFCYGGEVKNQLLQAFYQSGFPFYFSKKQFEHENNFKKILIPIDFRNSTKDATLWGSYLGRFNNSQINLLIANEKDQEQKQKVESIVAFVTKFYHQFSFPFSVFKGNNSSWGIHKEAVSFHEEHDLLIFTGSLNVTLLDQLVGPFEKRLVNQSKKPVLLINPQKELYVLCS